MLFGASTFVWVSPFTSKSFDILYKIKNMGYDIIEVAVENPALVNWQELKHIADDLDLKITLSGAFGSERDISSSEESIRKNGIQYIIDCITIAGSVGSEIFGGPLYSAVGKTRVISDEQKKRERAWCISGLKYVSKVADDFGITLGLEPLNRFETDMVNTVDQAISLVMEVENPNLKIVLDTFHANIEEKSIPGAIRRLGKGLLCHVQANECDRGAAGTGHIDWQGIKTALEEIDYTGAMVLETFGAPSEEIARAASIWRPLASSADVLAIETIDFYKKLKNKQ